MKRARFLQDRGGQGTLEFIATVPIYLFLFFLVLYFGLYMWMQIVTSAALHDAVRATAETGDVSLGYRRASALMEAGLGGLSRGPRSAMVIYVNPASRGVQGRVDYAWRNELLGFGLAPLRVRASSYMRLERFYGGPPGRIE